jgi:DNA-binding CsgD family transcriptional regulator
VSRPAEPGSLSIDVLEGLERVGVPSYLADREGRIRWLNEEALSTFGDARGRLLSSLAAPDHAQRSREQLAKKVIGGVLRTDFEIDVIGRNGKRTTWCVSSVPVRRDRTVVGVFGVARPCGVTGRERAAGPGAASGSRLTPRQREVLTLLADGASTTQIAATLGLAEETVRNHIRQLLRRLGVHTRLAAVAYARREGLI